MTFEQAFLKVKSKFADADVSKLDGDFAIQVIMTDEDCGGTFYIQSLGGSLNVEPYDYHDHTANVMIKKLDLYKILDGKLTVDKAVESGKAVVEGNAGNLASAAACIPVKEATPKKAERKTAPKKAEKKEAKSTSVKAAEKKTAPKKTAAKSAPAAETKPEPAPKAAAKKTVKK